MATPRLEASRTGKRSLAVFTRLAAIFVGLANLIVLTVLSSSDSSAWRNATWTEALPFVAAVVVAGLVTSEIVLRWLRSAVLAEKFLDRYANSVVVVCLGRVMMGFLLTYAITLNALLLAPSSVSGRWRCWSGC